MRQDEENSEEEFVEIDPTGRFGRVCSSMLEFSFSNHFLEYFSIINLFVSHFTV